VARVVALAPDLFFASKIEATLRAAGHEVTIVSSPAELPAGGEAADVLIVDLDNSDFAVGTPGVRRLGFYSHVDVDVRRKAEEAGFDLVVPRSRMAREMPELVSKLAVG
jgi:hypothetical protein